MPLRDIEARRAYSHENYMKHRVELLERKKTYADTHKEETRQRQHSWYTRNRDKVLARQNAYNADHRTESIMRADAWAKKNPGRKVEILKKERARRRGLLGFRPLNAYFIGSDAHHVDEVNVIHIPTRLHQQVRHNLRTGRNMAQINALAIGWLLEDWT